MITQRVDVEPRYDNWVQWPVYWSAVWVGMLTALAIGLLIGLIGSAVGAHFLGPEHREILSWKEFKIIALIFAVCGSFFAFVAGGWVAARIAGIRRSEPAILHGAIVWLLSIPFMLGFAAFGAASLYGDWYGGLGGSPSWVTTQATQMPEQQLPPNATSADKKAANQAPAKTSSEAKADAARNSALAALTALLIGLIGSVIGGWMASGEPMTFTHWRTRDQLVTQRPAEAASVSPPVEVPVRH
jgi:uncharacterized membrane protein YeaQ/YmgE (transglycosylase-associated protein family)